MHFNYFIQNISLIYNIDKNYIRYGSSDNSPVIIKQNIDDSFWRDKKDIDYSDIIWKTWKGNNIPFLFSKNSAMEIITYKNNQAIINYDIIASTFYFLSGWNELINSKKDEFGRVSYQDSIINKLNVNNIPVVNYYFDIFKEAYEKINNTKIKKNNWGEYTFGVSLTHDIDTCKSAWLEGSFSELKKKRIFSIPKLIFLRVFNKDDWFNFNKISDIEKQYNAVSSFYFLPAKGKVGKFKNADYKINNSIKKAIKKLVNRGHEVGVHGSFGSSINKT